MWDASLGSVCIVRSSSSSCPAMHLSVVISLVKSRLISVFTLVQIFIQNLCPAHIKLADNAQWQRKGLSFCFQDWPVQFFTSSSAITFYVQLPHSVLLLNYVSL